MIKLTDQTIHDFYKIGSSFSQDFCIKQLDMIKKIKQINSFCVSRSDKKLIIETEDIYIKNKKTDLIHRLGKFEIRMNYLSCVSGLGFIDDDDIQIRNLTPLENEPGYDELIHHPHITEDMEDKNIFICWGWIGRNDCENVISEYMETFQIGPLLTFIIAFLESYHPDHQKSLEIFPAVFKSSDK